MAERAELLLACMMGNRWASTSNPTSATTNPATAAAGSPAAIPATSRPHLETILYSINGISATFSTVGVQVRGSGGTVMASVNHLVGGSTIANAALSYLGIPGKRGGTLTVSMNTVITSLTQSVSAAGWIEDTNG